MTHRASTTIGILLALSYHTLYKPSMPAKGFGRIDKIRRIRKKYLV